MTEIFDVQEPSGEVFNAGQPARVGVLTIISAEPVMMTDIEVTFDQEDQLKAIGKYAADENDISDDDDEDMSKIIQLLIDNYLEDKELELEESPKYVVKEV